MAGHMIVTEIDRHIQLLTAEVKPNPSLLPPFPHDETTGGRGKRLTTAVVLLLLLLHDSYDNLLHQLTTTPTPTTKWYTYISMVSMPWLRALLGPLLSAPLLVSARLGWAHLTE